MRRRTGTLPVADVIRVESAVAVSKIDVVYAVGDLVFYSLIYQDLEPVL